MVIYMCNECTNCFEGKQEEKQKCPFCKSEEYSYFNNLKTLEDIEDDFEWI